MFGTRRHAAPTQVPPTREATNPNAATAAVSAFKRRASDASLSSAAAAAALKARPTSPTNVADVQSKRRSRRSPSISSATDRRHELTRSSSIGSMMGRTFRSPSPGRSPAPISYDVPPIPNIPTADSYEFSSRPTSSSRKKNKLQTQNFRTASEKARDGQQGSWFGAASAHDLHTVRRTNSANQLPSIQMPFEPRSGSVSPSINFSYPRARTQSPCEGFRSSQTQDKTLVYDPNSRRMVPRAQLQTKARAELQEEYGESLHERPAIQKQLRQPEKQRIPKQPRLSRAGSHLARGTVARSITPAHEGNTSKPDLDLVSTPKPNSDAHDMIHLEADFVAQKPKMKKQMKRIQPGDSVETALTHKIQTNVAGVSLKRADQSDKTAAAASQNITSSSSTSDKTKKSASRVNSATRSPDSSSKINAAAGRESSKSPVRSARFASSADQLLVRHEPPPRSLSPRKSALKRSSPTRAVSPDDEGSEILSASANLTSNDETQRKSYRVSWDDRNTVVVSEPATQHATEPTGNSSLQTNKPWRNTGEKGTKKDVFVEKDETMSPRPALPSFGSVREKKPKEQEERPLVRPEHAVQIDTSVFIATPAEPAASRDREPLTAILPSRETDDELSSSDGYLMEDTSDNDIESEAETAHSRANRSPDEGTTNIDDTAVPKISVPHDSPRQQIDKEKNTVQMPDTPKADDKPASGNIEICDTHGAGTSSQMDDIKEEEEEGDLYSDAYEEIAEGSGNGFLSLAAVLESSTNPLKAKAVTDQPVAQEAAIAADSEVSMQADSVDDWENAKAYWKSLSSEKRRQLEQEAMAEAEEDIQDKPISAKTEMPKQVSKYSDQNSTSKINGQPFSKSTDRTTELGDSQQSTANGSTLQIATRESQNVKKLKPESPTPSEGLHKSMRVGRPVSAGGERPSKPFIAPSSPTRGARMKRTLRVSSSERGDAEFPPSSSMQGRPASFCAAPESVYAMNNRGAGVYTTSLRRRGSDSSESSFTRSRAGLSGPNEYRRSMRDSMRSPSAATSDGIEESYGLNLRGHSSPGISMRRNSVLSLPPVISSSGTGRMRHSLRSGSVEALPRKRLSSLGKSVTDRKKKGKGGSRFVDSSDEEEDGTGTGLFKSRFADSSSEESEAQAKPKGKFPKSLRSKTNLRSTLSAVNLSHAQRRHEPLTVFENNILLTQPRQAESGQQNDGATVSPIHKDMSGESGHGFFRPQRNRRGSFISLLRRKKNSVDRVNHGILESATRGDTGLERNLEELDAVRSASMHETGPIWPLLEPGNRDEIVANKTERPSTAGGPYFGGGLDRSKHTRRRSASHGMIPAEENGMVPKTATTRKKKFGTLRKIFRLHD